MKNKYSKQNMTNQNFDVFDIGSQDNQYILVYEDEISEETIDDLFLIAETRLESLDEERKVKKKIFNVLVECLQNVFKHGEHNKIDKSKVFCQLIIGRNKNSYFVFTVNLIDKFNVNTLREKIDNLNDLSDDDLKARYYDVLKSQEFSDKGGAGLGLMDILRKSGNKLEYYFKNINNQLSFISLKANISLPS